MSLDQKKFKAALSRLKKEANIWLATNRKDHSPHLIPIWFIWLEDEVWIATGRGTQKHLNIQRDPLVTLVLEDGVKPVILEGTAAEKDDKAQRDKLAPHFEKKYEWDFRTDDDENWMLIAIAPTKILSW